MKNLLLLSLIITVFFGCKKDEEQEKLMKMRFNLSNDWHLHSLETTEPLKFRHSRVLDDCDKLATWRFEKTGYFSRTQDLSCNPYLYVQDGSWTIENAKILKLDLRQPTIDSVPPRNDKTSSFTYVIEGISADTLKIKQDILIYDADINSTISGVEEYILI